MSSSRCIQAGEARAEHEQRVKALDAEIERLGKNEEMSSVLIGDMQKQIDEYAHSKGELEVMRSALKPAPRPQPEHIACLPPSAA